MICADVDLRESSAIRTVKQPLKRAGCGRDWDNRLVAFSNLSITEDYVEKGMELEMKMMEGDLSSDNPRSGCNPVELDAAAG